jgi:hypothetical protein
MRQDAPHFIILLCLIPNDFTRKRESAPTQWDKPTFTLSLCQKKNERALTCRHLIRQDVLTLQLAINTNISRQIEI